MKSSRSARFFQLSLASPNTQGFFHFFSIAAHLAQHAHPAQHAHLQASTSENLQLESARDYRPSVPLVRQPLCGRSQDMSRVWWHWGSHLRLYECKINWNFPTRILDCQQLLHSCFSKFISVCSGSWCLISPIPFGWRKVGGYGFKLLLKKKSNHGKRRNSVTGSGRKPC